MTQLSPSLYFIVFYFILLNFILFCFITTAARWAVVVIESKSCLIDLPTFSYSPTRATKNIIVESHELEEVKTIKKGNS